MPRPVEPERRKLRQHLALVRDTRAQHIVERGDPVRGDDEEGVAEVVDVANFALLMRREPVQSCLEDGFGGRHGRFSKGAGILQGALRARNRTQDCRLPLLRGLIYCVTQFRRLQGSVCAYVRSQSPFWRSLSSPGFFATRISETSGSTFVGLASTCFWRDSGRSS